MIEAYATPKHITPITQRKIQKTTPTTWDNSRLWISVSMRCEIPNKRPNQLIKSEKMRITIFIKYDSCIIGNFKIDYSVN